jgi:hypothetical protein
MKRNTVLLNCLYHEIHCPEDDPGAMFLILYIIHFKTYMLPQTLEFKQIVQLAKIAERYDLNHILIGYVDTWLAPYHARLLEAGFEEWLFVAWQFGLENHYFTLANHLAMNCQVDENFYLLEVGSDLPIVGTYPPDTLCTYHLLKNSYFSANSYRPHRRRQKQCTRKTALCHIHLPQGPPRDAKLPARKRTRSRENSLHCPEPLGLAALFDEPQVISICKHCSHPPISLPDGKDTDGWGHGGIHAERLPGQVAALPSRRVV